MTIRQLCLVIDDEPDIRKLMNSTLATMDVECQTAENITQAKSYLEVQTYDLCLTDMKLPDGNGLDLVSMIQQDYPQTPVIVITAFGNMESAVRAYRAGAFDFISKPFELERLRELIQNALRLSKQREDVLSNLIGNSKVMQAMRKTIEKIARSEAPIYIRGESGVGKEVVARTIHKLGVRADKPFIPVNCGAIPAELMESEFFGYRRGGFTGANTNKSGLFQAADNGTLLLDEVGDLPISMQVKLLRVIQERQFRPIGAIKEVRMDVRILSATHHNLAQLVKENRFRQDLFYRINVIELYVPSLRERIEDIPLLVEAILNRLSVNTSQIPFKLTDAAMAALISYPFPGNVRELENILERAVTLCRSHLIDINELQLSNHCQTEQSQECNQGWVRDLASSKLGDDGCFVDEKQEILSALKQARGNKAKAAKMLGIGLGALRHRLRKFEIDD